jgi:hypothetical protein
VLIEYERKNLGLFLKVECSRKVCFEKKNHKAQKKVEKENGRDKQSQNQKV